MPKIDSDTLAMQETLPEAPLEGLSATLPEASPSFTAGLISGSKVGRYSVLELIGSGGMGSVYAAYDPVLDRRVALKVLRNLGGSNLESDPGQERLLREAQALAKLNHPNIVSVYDVASHDGTLHIAMEYVEGQDLRSWLEASNREPAEILRVFGEAGIALQAAHDAEVVHRDFKPENVIVAKDGSVRVIDFGIARLLSGVEQPLPSSEDSTSLQDPQQLETQLGLVMGTPAYMALEQFHGESDPRTDQFSFAMCLYEALVGSAPYGGKDIDERIRMLEEEKCSPVPPSVQISSSAAAALMRALRGEREARFPSMLELLEQLGISAAIGLEEQRLQQIGRANDEGLESHRRVLAGTTTIVFLMAVIGVLYATNSGFRTIYSPRAVATIALVLWLGVSGMLWRFRQAFSASNYNRRWALMIWAIPTTLLAHRAIALLSSQTSTDIIRTDVFLLATCALMFASFSRLFFAVAGLLVTMASLATVYPSLTRSFLNGGGLLVAGSVWFVWNRKHTK